jgi:hypothetical protein
MILLTSQRQVALLDLHKPSQIFIDGYHKIPSSYKQLVTIMAYFPSLKQAIPIFHCLTNKKTCQIYQQMFLTFEAIMKELLNKRDATLNCPIITLDFEMALLEAIKWNWPKSKLQGCFFHFIKCQIYKLRELGFSKKEYRKDTYRLVTLLSALPFVENGIVISVFECIKSQDLFKDY